MEVRAGSSADADGVNAVYNHYVETSHVTFDIEPWTSARREAWIESHGGGRHCFLVAVDGGQLVGFASSGPLRDRPAYDTSVETSVYVAPSAVGKGVGARLYQSLFDALGGADVHRAYGLIALPNAGSIALHERFGFRRVAHLTEVGYKLGCFWDVAWYEKPLPK